MTATDADGSARTVAFTWDVAEAVTLYGSSKVSHVGVPDSTSVSIDGGTRPYTWSATGLPSGFTINPTTGVISGTPTAVSSRSATVKVVDASGGSATTTIDWDVTVALVASVANQVSEVNTPVSLQLTATGGQAPYTWQRLPYAPDLSGLPTGLTLNAVTGLISGTPTIKGTYRDVALSVTDSRGLSTNIYFDWTVKDPVVVTTTAGGGQNTTLLGEPTTLQPTASGGTAPYTWVATGFPAGMSIDGATGLISGTPAAEEAVDVTISVTDANGRRGSDTFSWFVVPLLDDLQALPGARLSDLSTYGAPYFIHIRDMSANITVGSCPAAEVFCTFDGLSYKGAGAHTFRATLARHDGSDVRATHTWTVNFPATAPPTPFITGAYVDYPGALGFATEYTPNAVHQIAIQASISEDINATPYYLKVIDLTANETVASCGSGRSCTAIVSNTRAGHRFQATLTNGATTIDTFAVMDGNPADFSAQTLDISLDGDTVRASTNRNMGTPLTMSMALVDARGHAEWTYHFVVSRRPSPGKSCTNTRCTWSYIPGDNGSFLKPGRTYLVEMGGRRSEAVTFSLPPVAPALPSAETIGGQNPSQPTTQVCSCDPVNTATGEFFDTATDIALSGKGPGLGLTRTYSSKLNTNDGPLGFGWSMNYGASLQFSGTAGSPADVIVHQEHGSTVTFSVDSTGGYRAPGNVLASLVHKPDGSWTFTRRAQDIMVFDAGGRLTALKDLHGNTVALTYNNNGRLASATGAGGRTLTFDWVGAHLTAVHDTAGRTVSYRYDAAGRLIAVTDVDGAVERYGYDTAHRMVLMTERTGGFTRNTYDSSGRVVRQIDPLGQPTTIEYSGTPASSTTTVTAPDGAVTVSSFTNGYLRTKTMGHGTDQQQTWQYNVDNAGNTTAITDPLGKTVYYSFDGRGNRTAQADALGRVTTWTYNQTNKLTSTTDPLNRVTSHTYNVAGALLTTTTPDGRVQRWTYNADGTVATHTAPGGAVTAFAYDTAGRTTTTTNADGSVNAVSYDTAGNAVATTDAQGHVTSRTFDSAGRVLTTTEPGNRTTRSAYDADGHPTTVTDPSGATTTTRYDLLGRVVAEIDATGATVTTAYTPGGQVAKTTDANGKATSYQYNALGLLSAVTDPNDRTVRYTYDADGRPVTATLPSGARTTTAYDAVGQVTSSTDANGDTSTYTYDTAGQPTATTDALQRVTRRTYTADGLLSTVVAADGGTTKYAYDPDGEVAKVTNPDGGETTYAYNTVGLQVTRTQPGGLLTRYTYDPTGRPLTTVNPDGTTVTKAYNTAGDLTGVDYSASNTPDVTYTYDATGRRATMTDGTGTTRYTYDPAGRLTASTDGAGATVGYRYDPAGRLRTLAYPGGDEVTYTYDDAGQMTSATDWAGRTTTFAWTPDGNLGAQQTPNGVNNTITHDNTGRARALTLTKASTTLANSTYTYDAAGQLTTDTQHTYTFNTAGRLAAVNGPTSTGTYTTTPGGKLTGLPNGTTLTYNTAQHLTGTHRTAAPSTSYQYDANGNRTQATTAASETTAAKTTAYRYNATGALTGVTTPNGTSTSYTAGGDGLRHTRHTNGNTKHFTWATAGTMPLILDDGDNRYLYGPTLTPYAQISDNGTTHYLHTDGLGSVRTITDTTGAVVATNTYDPYGNRTNHTGTTDSPIGYTGAWTDHTTGLIHLRARDYDPTTGQFLTIDPLADATHQPYAYANNNPLQNTDPSGLCADCNWLENIVISAPSNWLADNLQHGPASHVVSFFEAIGDTASFGLTGLMREAISPGSSCFVKEDSNAYLGGELAMYLVPAGGAAKAAHQAYSGWRARRIAQALPSVAGTSVPRASTDLVKYDARVASQTALSQTFNPAGYATTPAGRTLSGHAAARVAYGHNNRPPTTLSRVDEILENGTEIRYNPIRDTIRVRQPRFPGKPYVVVSGGNGNHVVTVMVPK